MTRVLNRKTFTIFRAAARGRRERERERERERIAKIGCVSMRKIGVRIYDRNYKGGKQHTTRRIRLKNCARVVSGSISQRYVRA